MAWFQNSMERVKLAILVAWIKRINLKRYYFSFFSVLPYISFMYMDFIWVNLSEIDCFSSSGSSGRVGLTGYLQSC